MMSADEPEDEPCDEVCIYMLATVAFFPKLGGLACSYAVDLEFSSVHSSIYGDDMQY